MSHKNFTEFLTETPLPDDWDKHVFTPKTSFKDQLEYALARAKSVGKGSSRVAFEIEYKGKPTILKIAKNDKGLAQNQDEISIMKRAKADFFDMIIPLIDHDVDNAKPIWIHVEKAEIVKETRLCDLLNVPNLKTLIRAATSKISKKEKQAALDYIEMFNDNSPKHFKIVEVYIEILAKLEKEYEVELIDFTQTANWGLYKGRPVIIDLGYTKSVSDNFYKKTKS